jgi:hypothetical protein
MARFPRCFVKAQPSRGRCAQGDANAPGRILKLGAITSGIRQYFAVVICRFSG